MAAYQRLSEQEALTALRSRPEGLGTEEVRLRLDRYGPNQLPDVARPSPLLRFLAQFKDFFAVLLEVAGSITLAAYLVQGNGTDLKVALAIFAVVLLNAVIGFAQEIGRRRRPRR